MRRRPLLVLLFVVWLQYPCHAQNFLHARAIAAAAGRESTDNSGMAAASATSTSDFGSGTFIAQAHVKGVDFSEITLPQSFPLYLGAAATSDVRNPTQPPALSIATASWIDSMTIVSPTHVDKVIFSISLLGTTAVSFYDPHPDFPNTPPLAHGYVELNVINHKSGGSIHHRYRVNNLIQGTDSPVYEVTMEPNITAAPVDYSDPNNSGTRINYVLDLNQNVLDFTVSLQTIAAASEGIAHSLFSDTAFLTGVFLEDGTTPESHGMTLVFDSGIASPNIVVPEPGTITSLCLGLCGLIGGAIFRPSRRSLRKMASRSA